MPLEPGRSLGHYRIVRQIGQGGMGAVFLAEDTKLNRQVALKVLPPAFAQDADRVARFRREAQVLASLGHPNIAAIYGLEELEGIVALALELIEGEDLAERLKRGPMPVDEAIAAAKGIADGLEAAHEKGIVHRDLKPANVTISRDGAVKLLDFGLAKALAGDPAATEGGQSQSPTMTRPMTEAGFILGTAAYMSPEQARGRPVDKRADIWSFGVVLFEMLSGRRLFAGETVSDVIASVLKTEPAWDDLPAATPDRVRALLRRCLERDTRQRLRDIGEARIALERPSVDLAAAAAPGPAHGARGRRLRWAMALASLGVTVLVTALWLSRPTPAPPQLARLEVALPVDSELNVGLGGSPIAFSPDGSMLAFITAESGWRRVHVRRLDSLEDRVLQGGLAPLGLFFSLDGTQLGIIGTDRTIRQVSLRDGATAQRIRDASFPGGAFLPDGGIVCVRDETLWLAPAGDGEPRPLTKLDPSHDERSHRWPSVLPSGETVLFTVQQGAEREDHIEALRIKTGERLLVEARGSLPMYVAPGYLLFGRDDEIMAAPFDADTVKVTGTPRKILSGVSLSGMRIPLMAASNTGHLVYLPRGDVLRTLVWVAKDGTETPLTLPPDSYANPRIAPDGRRIAVTVSGGIWIADPLRATLTRLTSAGDFALWSHDGQSLFYRTLGGMYHIPSDGTGSPHLFGAEGANEFPSGMSPDGKLLASVRIVSTTGADLYVHPADGSDGGKPLLASAAYEGGPEFSPDGRWLIYTSDDSNRTEVYIRPFPGPDRRWQVSNDGGTHPHWDPGGRLIYYRQGSRMMVVDVRSSGPVPDLSPPHPLFEGTYAYGGNLSIPNYDISRDGSRLLMLRNLRSMTHLSLILNWSELLRAR